MPQVSSATSSGTATMFTNIKVYKMFTKQINKVLILIYGLLNWKTLVNT